MQLATKGLLRQPLFHLLYNIIGCRTNSNIFYCEVRDLMKILPIGMGEFTAGFRTYIVDEAVIIGGKKSAWHFLQNIIIFFIDAQVLIDELLRLLAQVSGDALNIFIGKKRTCGFTTVSTAKAVGATEFLFVQLLHLQVKMPGWLLFKLREKLLILLMFIFGLLWKPI